MKLFMYGTLLRPSLRAGLGLSPSGWLDGVSADGWKVTLTWGDEAGPPALVVSPGDVAYGAVGTFSEEDVATLNFYEGVSSGLYRVDDIETSAGWCKFYRPVLVKEERDAIRAGVRR